MKHVAKLLAITTSIGVAGCGPSKWDLLREAEHQNQVEIRLYCDATPPNKTLCAAARSQSKSLAATRAQYIREEQEKCKRAWEKYDRDLADYDRKLAEYDRELERHERERERKQRQCDREQDRYDRAMDRYYRCLDRESTDTYSYCSRPTIPFCLSSLSLGPTRPSKPIRPFCTP